MSVTDDQIAELLREHAGPAYPVAPRALRRTPRRVWTIALAAAALLLVPGTAISHGLVDAFHFDRQRAPYNVFSDSFTRGATPWERLTLRRGAIDVRVRSVAITASTWRVRADVVNDSPYTVALRRGRSWATAGIARRIVGFGVAFQPLRELYNGGSATHRLTAIPANTFTPALPARLAPHARWSGELAGYALLPRDRPIYVTFGGFSPQGEWPSARGYVYQGLPGTAAARRAQPVDAKTLISNHPFTLP